MSIFKKLAEKPWIQDPSDVAELRSASFATSNQKVALVAFLAIVAVLFFLFFAAYHMRIELTTDWVAIPEPPLMWFNTVVLIVASIAFEVARKAVGKSQAGMTKTAFNIAGGLTIVFLVLQFVVWNQMLALGYYAYENPANAFFYLLTAVHGLHLLGGLIAWARASWRFAYDADHGRIARSVDLCALYWHFLLLIWVGLFAMFLNT